MVCLYHVRETVSETIPGCIRSILQTVYAVADPGIMGDICYHGAGQAFDLSEQDVSFCEDGLCAQCQSLGLSPLWEDLCAAFCDICSGLCAKGEEEADADTKEQIRNISGVCYIPVMPVLSGAWNGQSVFIL